MTDHHTGFPKSSRLLTSADYAGVFKGAEAVSDQAFTILCRPNELGHPRLGLAISKKALARAVDRNLVKRLVRESFRQRAAQLGSRDFVVLSRRGMRPDERAGLRRSLERLWGRSLERCSATSATSVPGSKGREQA